ncbi:hypothetical protein VTJ04DRAFT_4181 [Mycothermus thermophilus]|uniref:uncharacterized protein n=1 Tax=Humicola insolens TaxID=85995 RepID=UPI003743139A
MSATSGVRTFTDILSVDRFKPVMVLTLGLQPARWSSALNPSAQDQKPCPKAACILPSAHLRLLTMLCGCVTPGREGRSVAFVSSRGGQSWRTAAATGSSSLQVLTCTHAAEV